MFKISLISLKFVIQRLLCPFVGLLMLLSNASAHSETRHFGSEWSSTVANGDGANVTAGSRGISKICIQALMAPHSQWFLAKVLMSPDLLEYALYLKGRYLTMPTQSILKRNEQDWETLWNDQYKILKVSDAPFEKEHTPSLERILLFLDFSIELNQSPLSLSYEIIVLKSYCFFNTDSRSTGYPGSCMTDSAVMEIIRASRKYNLSLRDVVSHIKEWQRRMGPRYLVDEGAFLSWLLFEMDPGIREARWRGI
jgi:hypothetical protein